MPASCDRDTLTANSRCFLEQCTSENEREGLLIYFRVLNLAAAGGASYNIDSLQTAAKTWQSLSHAQRSAINVYIAQQNAITNGADSANASIDVLKAAARCYMCLPKEFRLQLLEFLYCAISGVEVAD